MKKVQPIKTQRRTRNNLLCDEIWKDLNKLQYNDFNCLLSEPVNNIFDLEEIFLFFERPIILTL